MCETRATNARIPNREWSIYSFISIVPAQEVVCNRERI